MIKRYLFLFSFMLLGGMVFAQQPTRAELEKERAAIQREIDDVKASLDQTTKTKKATLGQLALVQKKLRQREALINNINKQIGLIDDDIYQSNRDIYKLRKELDTLKMQYEKSVVYAYKNRSSYDFLNFLFSSTSFNDALRRVSYLRSYRNYREQQAQTIRNTQDVLQQKISGLNENKKKKGDALQEENQQRVVLEDERKEKNEVISGLKSREKELGKQLAAKKKQNQQLNSAIATAIRKAREDAIREAKAAAAKKEAEERERAASIAKAKSATTNPSSKPSATTPSSGSGAEEPAVVRTTPKKALDLSPLDADPASRKLSEDFIKNQGQLPWPVDNGHVKAPFGVYTIEGTTIRYDNPGITIETEPGKSVKAVFSGIVVSSDVIGSGHAVIIRHGKYFTSYSNLLSSSVSKGQTVSIGQVIGKAGSNDEDNGEIDFLITNDANKNLDPERWLRK